MYDLNLMHKRIIILEERLNAIQDNRKGITDNPDYIESVNPDYIPVDLDGVWQVSSTTMNLLYAMYLWADEHGIDNEDDWENHLELHNLQGAKH